MPIKLTAGTNQLRLNSGVLQTKLKEDKLKLFSIPRPPILAFQQALKEELFVPSDNISYDQPLVCENLDCVKSSSTALQSSSEKFLSVPLLKSYPQGVNNCKTRNYFLITILWPLENEERKTAILMPL
jgi:hypothetical protein